MFLLVRRQYCDHSLERLVSIIRYHVEGMVIDYHSVIHTDILHKRAESYIVIN